MSSTADFTGEPAHRQHYNLTFSVLVLAGCTFALLQSLVAPALPEIQRDLHTTPTAVAWVLTAYLLSASVLTPIIGRLGDMFGKEHTLVASLSILGVGTLVAALATSIEVLIIGRVIQGAGGAVFPLAFGIIRDEFPRERVARGIAFLSALMGIGGGVGIILAGPIVDALSYHWLFWIPLIMVVAAVIATLLFVPESPITTPGRINWLGAGLLSGWLVCILIAVSEGSSWGWTSGRTIGLFLAGIVLCLVWIRNESRAPEPLVDMKMMRIRGVWTVNAAAFLVGAGMYSSFVLIPEFVSEPTSSGYGFGASVTQAGLFLAPSTLGMLLLGPVSGRLSEKVGSRVPLILGGITTTISFLLLAFAHGERFEIYIASFILGAGIGLAFASLANLIVEAVPPEQTGVATGMNTVMRTLGGSVGGQIGASVLAGSIVAGVPTEAGFTAAFGLAAGACALATLAALAVPKPRAAQEARHAASTVRAAA
jgi:EmrB/QacA subfamily drug resistance transporter